MLPPVLEFVVIGNDVDAAQTVAASCRGVAYADDRTEAKDLPFRTLVRAVTDRPADLDAAGSVGRYVVCARPQRVRPGADPVDGVIQINAMVGHPSLGHDGADAHWRDLHAPLALRHHVAMSQYTQLSVLHRISGPEYDGFALCEFDSMNDLRDHFFDGPEGKRIILADVASFADQERSPRRLVARRL